MSCVHVFVGQCGNQLGASLLQRIASEAENSASDEFQQDVSSAFFRQAPSLTNDRIESRPCARAILVDMEPKVIEQVVAACEVSGKYTVHPNQCVSRGEGSANNWAFGYLQQGPSRAEAIAESLRRESEISGTVSTFHVVHSAAGGTGSGVGCLVSDLIRDEYPRALLLHSVVWPFAHGEVTTQWYNCTLALSCLVDNADGILILPNDDAVAQLSARAGGGHGASPLAADSEALHRVGSLAVSYERLNAVFGESLASMVLPQSVCTIPQARRVEKRSRLLTRDHATGPEAATVLQPASLFNLAEAITDPCRKLFHAQSCPSRGEGSLSQALKHVSWAQSTRETLRVIERTAAYRCAVVARGSAVLAEGAAELSSALAESSPSLDLQGRLAAFHSSMAPFGSFSSHMTAFYTTPRTGTLLSGALAHVEAMLDVRAFTHHFTRYGVSVDDIKDATVRAWSVVADYDEQ
jgi:hypothetical protein